VEIEMRTGEERKRRLEENHIERCSRISFVNLLLTSQFFNYHVNVHIICYLRVAD